MKQKVRIKEIEVIRDSFFKGKIAPTIEQCELYLQQQPNNAYVLNLFGIVLTEIARYPEAKISLKASLKFCKKKMRHMPCVELGHLYEELGNYKKAELWYKYALKYKSKDTNTLVFLGACLAKQGKYKKAKKYHKMAIKFSTELPDEAYFNLGLIYRAEGKYKKSCSAFKKAIKLDSDYKKAKSALNDVLEAMQIKKQQII